MGFDLLRNELRQYYVCELEDRAAAFTKDAFEAMEAEDRDDLSPTRRKVLQYRVLAEKIKPVVFRNTKFFYSTGSFGGRRHWSAAAQWCADRNDHLYIDQDPELWARRRAQAKEKLYLICGPYNDIHDHFVYHFRSVLEKGLRGTYEEARIALSDPTNTEKEKEFLWGVTQALETVRAIQSSFAREAVRLAEKAERASDFAAEKHYRAVAAAAEKCPWEKPETLAEALNGYLFMKEMIEGLEGVSLHSFGRLDLDLLPYYRNDLAHGRLTEKSARDLIAEFLLCSDCRYDHDMKMVGYADHELENTYVVGGCDESGSPVFNDLTRLFLSVTREEKIIYPKIICRYGVSSPDDYLREACEAVAQGMTSVLFQNDDCSIPALVRAGFPLAESRDYLVAGCWGTKLNALEADEDGNYLNILRPFEWSVYQPEAEMERTGLHFAPIDGAKDFETLYAITLDNIRMLMEERLRITKEGGRIWDRVDALPLLSANYPDCLKKKKDFTAGGTRYAAEKFCLFGFPNLIDCFCALKELVFDRKKYTLAEYLDAVRRNWEGNEKMRIEAIRSAGWGDGKPESTAMARRFMDDLYAMASEMTSYRGGAPLLGHLTYTEIRFWGECTKATPDGRKDGSPFAQGLTPSRLKSIPSSADVLVSLAALDGSQIAGNSVVNIILPGGKTDASNCAAFLRGAATAMGALQLNVVSKETLLDAQQHPENYPDLIVRVTGFSARFTSLSTEWQQEFLTRNFYEN